MFLLPEADLLPDLSKNLPCSTALLWLAVAPPWSSIQGRGLIWGCQSLPFGWRKRWNPASALSSFVFICEIDYSVSFSSFINIWHFTGDRHSPHTCQWGLLGLHRVCFIFPSALLCSWASRPRLMRKGDLAAQTGLSPFTLSSSSSASLGTGQNTLPSQLSPRPDLLRNAFLSFHFVLKSNSEKNCKISPSQVRPSL